MKRACVALLFTMMFGACQPHQSEKSPRPKTGALTYQESLALYQSEMDELRCVRTHERAYRKQIADEVARDRRQAEEAVEAAIDQRNRHRGEPHYSAWEKDLDKKEKAIENAKAACARVTKECDQRVQQRLNESAEREARQWKKALDAWVRKEAADPDAKGTPDPKMAPLELTRPDLPSQ